MMLNNDVSIALNIIKGNCHYFDPMSFIIAQNINTEFAVILLLLTERNIYIIDTDSEFNGHTKESKETSNLMYNRINPLSTD